MWAELLPELIELDDWGYPAFRTSLYRPLRATITHPQPARRRIACAASILFTRVGYGNATTLRDGKLLRSLSPHVVFATTANPYYSLDGVRPGTRVASVVKRLHLGRPIRIGPNTW